jgi:hypothetical protein
MEIQAFGYLGVGASNLDDWAAFATSNVGMQAVDRASSMRVLPYGRPQTAPVHRPGH